MWQDLTSGRIGIKRYYDERGRRFLILKPLSQGAALADLSERERRAMGYRAFGQGFSQIATELGVATATVMNDLARARSRLGIGSDLELPAILAAGTRKAVVTERGPKSGVRPASIRMRQREIWRQAFRAPNGLRREPSPKAGKQLIISFPISEVHWRRGLSPAEISVAEDTLGGASRSQIAARRGVAVRTVTNQIAAVFQKLGVSSRLEFKIYVMAGPHAVEHRPRASQSNGPRKRL